MNELIKSIIIKNLGDYQFSMIILFGSRARNNAREDSDYDLLVVLKDGLTIDETRIIQRNIRKDCALIDIDADILVRTEDVVRKLKNQSGNVIYEALKDGVAL